ncbi:hypothetical protein ACFSRY_01750 [Pontibacter locisalis]|uniref:Uncharacterized protein n=1 Tax=Pontibacter locisalis TaxID=1719035 RepID=A0ABW5IHV9_9BACT
MIRFLKHLFGLKGVTGNRTVVGSPESIDTRDLPYIQDSQKRLTALLELYNRYKTTPHAQKIYSVYEKTKRIHAYLIARNKAHELELFHLQHTDHFLNTFTIIINAHQHRNPQVSQYRQPRSWASSPPPPPPPSPRPATRPEVIGRTLVFGPFRSESKEVKAVQMQQSRETGQRIFVETKHAKTNIARLTVPEVAIDTYSKIVYLKEDVSDGLTTSEIGYTSTTEEKEAFVNYVAARLGIEEVSYVGNTMTSLHNHDSSNPAEMVPVIHWNGCPYALLLEEDRLFPVKTFGKSR